MFTDTAVLERRLVLIDIENVAGGAITMAEQVWDARAALTEAAALDSSTDHIVVACGWESAHCVGFEWDGSRRFLFRPGIDGADLELLAVLETENIAERFTNVLLVSGDAIFTEAVSLLRELGVAVTVASRTESFSHRLQMAASNTMELDYEFNSVQEAA